MILLLHLVVLGFTGAAAWWLSGYDTQLTRDDPARDLRRRGLRCAVTLVLVEASLSGLVRWVQHRDMFGGYTYIALAIPLGLTWTGCLSELFARGFSRMIFQEDDREADLGESRRALDQLALLVREGKKEEAIQLCQQLRESGDASDLALDAMLTRLGVDPATVGGLGARPSKPLAEADQLRALGRLSEAEAKLKALLQQEPSNQAAALLLMRLYAQDLCAPDKAKEVLQRIAKERFIPLAFIEYAQRSLVEWSQPGANIPTEARRERPQVVGQGSETVAVTAVSVEESVKELLANGYLGSAVELLEQQLKGRPNDFGLWLKLAEVQGVHCGNLSRAGKIIKRLEDNPAFSPEQVREAQAKLKEWKAKQNVP